MYVEHSRCIRLWPTCIFSRNMFDILTAHSPQFDRAPNMRSKHWDNKINTKTMYKRLKILRLDDRILVLYIRRTCNVCLFAHHVFGWISVKSSLSWLFNTYYILQKRKQPSTQLGLSNTKNASFHIVQSEHCQHGWGYTQ